MSFCGGGKTTDHANEAIERQLKQDRIKALNEVKLLLLGTGESGKSTIAKQLKIMHMDGFSEPEREMFRTIIHSNILESTVTLVKNARVFGYFMATPELQQFADRFSELPVPVVNVDSYVNPQTGRIIAELWKDPAIQQTYDRKAEFQLACSAEYILPNAERLLTPRTPITNDDALHSRMRTMGIVEIQFSLDGLYFRVVDVGGQRGERKKWIHCFGGVTAVLFCIALNEYDEKLYEDHRVNRMEEAIQLFQETCNNACFNDPANPTSMIVFLNKNDLFQDKIRKVPLTNLFPDYKGGADATAGARYIFERLQAQNRKPNKLIFSHVTCATDTQNVRVVFNAVRTVVMKRSLNDANLF